MTPARSFVAILFFAGPTFAQSRDLLPAAQHISGVVVDPEGKPVAGMRIDHADILNELLQTDAQGRFDFNTRAPLIILRRPGFESELLRPAEIVSPVKIRLKTENRDIVPDCRSKKHYVGIRKNDTGFRFPRLPDVLVSQQGRDVDYVSRSYYIKTDHGAKGIIDGHGPNWTNGVPDDHEVWKSVEYKETVRYAADGPVLDARGKWVDGTRWRYLAHIDESASYSGLDEPTARIFDSLLDQVCVEPRPRW